jgi:hypothetical protein
MRRLCAIAAVALPLVACAPGPEVWFRPNIGSPDMLDLFTREAEWSHARGQVDVFGFYALQVASSGACPACASNRLPNFVAAGAFARLREWGMAVDVEVPSVKASDCRAESALVLTLDALGSLRSQGMPARDISMDEPLLAAQPCALSPEETAVRVAAYVSAIHREMPGVAVGDIEPYPILPVASLIAWIDQQTAAGATPAFFHVDVDRAHAARIAADVDSDLRALQSAMAERHVPFGVILWGDDGTSDAAYAADVLKWTERVGGALGGAPPHVLFQSWTVSPDGASRVPANLPDDDPSQPSHTRLIRDGLVILHARR